MEGYFILVMSDIDWLGISYLRCILLRIIIRGSEFFPWSLSTTSPLHSIVIVLVLKSHVIFVTKLSRFTYRITHLYHWGNFSTFTSNLLEMYGTNDWTLLILTKSLSFGSTWASINVSNRVGFAVWRLRMTFMSCTSLWDERNLLKNFT